MAQRFGYVALAGRPNAGKSTLINTLTGEKVAIVSDTPQTTRHRILGVMQTGEIQMALLDLPGIHRPHYKMNQRMMKHVSQGLQEADVIIHLLDGKADPGSGDDHVSQVLKEQDKPVVMAVNKIDDINKSKLIPRLQAIQERFDPDVLVPISALTGDNVERLVEQVTQHLKEGPFHFDGDDFTDQPVRTMAAELIREKVLHYTREEIPHAVAVTVEHFQAQEDADLVEIGAIIWVERGSQRRIVLGAQGQMIRKIRIGAERSLRRFLGQRVAVELHVKVSKKWRDANEFLDQLPYLGKDPLDPQVRG